MVAVAQPLETWLVATVSCVLTLQARWETPASGVLTKSIYTTELALKTALGLDLQLMPRQGATGTNVGHHSSVTAALMRMDCRVCALRRLVAVHALGVQSIALTFPNALMIVVDVIVAMMTAMNASVHNESKMMVFCVLRLQVRDYRALLICQSAVMLKRRPIGENTTYLMAS